MKQKGFTLIELLIGIVILAIIGLVAVGSSGDRNSKLSIGINGLTESRCIEGYKFVVGEHGQARQILDELGKGVKCQ
jgi:prepilin-type N-terminal cleavage/methylation domain-containing protein